MRYYPRPKTRDEALAWIDWNRSNYERYGYGLWILQTWEDDFVGDCGLTWQTVEGGQYLEVGYHVVTAFQGQGLATEGASACLDLAFGEIGEEHVIAIVNPANHASRRVAEKIGMEVEREADAYGGQVVVYGMRATSASPRCCPVAPS